MLSAAVCLLSNIVRQIDFTTFKYVHGYCFRGFVCADDVFAVFKKMDCNPLIVRINCALTKSVFRVILLL